MRKRWQLAALGGLLALLGGLWWAAAPAAVPSPGGPRDFAVFAYELELQIDRDQEILRGLQKMHLRCTGDRLATVSFPRNGIEVLKVTSGGHALPVATRNSRFEMRLAAPLAQGEEVSLELAYSAARPKGVVFQPDAVYTSFHTCHWMVCRDRPDDKATFRLAIDVAEGLSLVASGAPVGEPKADGAPGRQVWLERVPSSPYLFGFALGRFARTARQHRGVTLEYFASKPDGPKLRQMFADDERMLDFFVQKAGRPLPRATYRQVVVAGDAAQEASSFSLLGRDHLEVRRTDPTEDWLVAHEMAHQFWGNAVTCADWSHFWLNEGLTVFMVAAYKEQRWGPGAYAHELGLLRARHQKARDENFDVPLTFAGEYPSLRIKRAIVYSKGALFAHRLRQAMGDRAFWVALARFTRDFTGRAAVTQDLQRVFAAHTSEDLSGLFKEWAYGAGSARRQENARGGREQ